MAIVTGGGRGIGRAVAGALHRDGWSVVVAGRTDASLDATVAELSASQSPDGPLISNAMAVRTNVADETEVAELFRRAVERFGRVDLLFNNAGIAAPAVPVDELAVDQWRDLLDVNVTGSFLCARAAFAQMRDQTPGGGRIINNGSVSATTPRPFSAAYTTSKHAITGLTKSLALDGRAHNIACGQIDIGNASSDMGDQMAAGVLQPNGTMLAEPTMAVDNVANAVAHMASLPLDANILHLTVLATGMPFVGRG